MTTPEPAPRRKHLMTDEQLAAIAHPSAEDRAQAHRDNGNGIRVHRVYIVVVSLAALVMLGVAIALASAKM